jgi:hypothetical protein
LKKVGMTMKTFINEKKYIETSNTKMYIYTSKIKPGYSRRGQDTPTAFMIIVNTSAKTLSLPSIC